MLASAMLVHLYQIRHNSFELFKVQHKNLKNFLIKDLYYLLHFNIVPEERGEAFDKE
jgi:hypothetical protein